MTVRGLVLQRLERPVDESYLPMTFPAYRHLLSLEPQPRYPSEGDDRLVVPIGVGAQRDGKPVGLVLAGVPYHGRGVPQLLSLYVDEAARDEGIATSLIGHIEELLVRDGFDRLGVTYMTGKPSIPIIERLLENRGWAAPVALMIVLRFTPQQAASTPWYGRIGLPSSGFEVFPWVELEETELSRIRQSHEAEPWIRTGLEPWRFPRHNLDPLSSLGLRYRGEVVGWVINHRLSDDMIRFTCSFIGKGLGKRGRLIPLFTESIERLKGSTCRMCTFTTPVRFASMVRFAKRHCAPWSTFFGEVRGSMKVLSKAAGEGL